PHHLLNTSWTLHRLSPLHHDKEFQSLLDNPTALNTYAARLRDLLTGDVLSGLQSGVQTGLGAGGVAEDDTLSKTGVLKSCIWEAIPQFDDTFTCEGYGQTGILITLSYETTTYKAALLASPDSNAHATSAPRKGLTPLPLLLTRLPTPPRQTLLTFLSTTFDTYISPLRLPAPFMCSGLDTYVTTFLSSGARDAAGILENVVRDVQLTVTFSGSVAPSLRSMGVGVPRGMIGGFLCGNGGGGEGFLGRIEGYLEAHLAMKLDLSTAGNRNGLAKQHVRVSKIACGGFVVGSEGRMKLSADLGRQSGGTGNRDGDGDGEGSRVLGEKERLELKANHALLLGVLRRAV
ncbi:uncharacterized protein EURHEDRAFT_437912, partial [Aspergillus ruber CBS 135680]